MRSPIRRLAAASSWCGRPTERRRALLLAVAAAVVCSLSLGCASAWRLSTRVIQRATARTHAAAVDGEPAALTMAALFDEIGDGRQIYVYLLRIDDPALRIAGIPGPPEVGRWWVTPALAERFADEPSLDRRYAGARVLDRVGVAHRGELLAYRVLGPGPPLPFRYGSAAGTDWIGDGGATVDLYPIVVAGVAVVGLPGIGLLVAALGPGADALDRRRRLLRSLGAPRRTEVAMVGWHVLFGAAPGAVIGALAWWAMAPRLTSVPMVGRSTFQGDLGLPIGWALTGAAAVVVLTIVIGLAGPRRRMGSSPSTAVPRRPGWGRLVPLVIGLAVLAIGVGLPGRAGVKVFLMGLVATSLGAVVGLPYLVHRAGRAVARRPSTISLLVGRRMCWNASTSARALLAAGALACLAPVLGAWVSVARDLDPASAQGPLVVGLHGTVPPEDVASLASRTGTVATVDHERGLVTFSAVNTADAGRLEEVLRSYAVNGDRPGVQVVVPGRSASHESPLVQWILGSAALAGLVGTGALGLHLATHAAELARSRARLVALGADITFLRRLAAAEAGGSVAIVGLGCTAVGAINSWMFVQRDATARVPYGVIGAVLVVVALASAVAGLAAALALPASPRRRRRAPTG